MMKPIARWSLALLALGAIRGSLAAGGNGDSSSTTWHRPELAYLKAVNRVGAPQDPQLLFLLNSGKAGLDVPQLAPVTPAAAFGKSK